MKKILIFLTVILLISSAVLASCENQSDSNSDTSTEVSSDQSQSSNTESSKNDSSKNESSKGESEKEESKPSNLKDPVPVGPNTEPIGSPLTVIGSSFSEKPYFVLIGKCALNAEVTGEANGETVTSKSYMGWFSLRLRCDGASVKVNLSQTVDGVKTGPTVEYNARPITPSKGMWPVVAGGDMQFFFQKMLPDFQGENIPTQAQLDSLTERISERMELLKNNKPDAEIIYLLVPSAMTVYPELVPEQYKQTEEKSRLDLVSEALTAGGATVIDLKSLFNEHKNDEMPLYFKLDSHWSDYGAFLAYTELFNHISEKFPDAKPHDISEFNWKGDYYESGDMCYYLGLSRFPIQEYSYYRTFNIPAPETVTYIPRYESSESLSYSEDVTYEKVVYTNNKKLPSAIVIRDSYSTQMYDILAERMKRTYYLGMWNYAWNKYKMESEKPDYVIYIVAEWNLDAILNG